MVRTKKARNCRHLCDEKVYKPIGIPMMELGLIEIDLDEFEALRLVDEEALNQIQAAVRMNISRATVQRLLNSGRKKIIRAMLANDAIKIKGVRPSEADVPPIILSPTTTNEEIEFL